MNNVASERAVLAGICSHGLDCYLDVSPFLEEKTFTVDENKILYQCLTSIIAKGHTPSFVGIISAATDLGLSEYINQQSVIKHIHGVLSTPIGLESVLPHAKKIRRLQFGRSLQEVIQTSHANLDGITGDESLVEIVSIVESPLQAVSSSYSKQDDHKPKDVGEGLRDHIQDLLDNEVRSIGIPSGMPSFDRAIGGGLRRKCIDLIGARPKVGKSTYSQAVALHVGGVLEIPVLILDTEMSSEELQDRMTASVSNVGVNEIASGSFRLNSAKVANVIASIDKIESVKCKHINVTGKPFDEVMSIARRWVLKDVGMVDGVTNDCLIIYDYFKITDSRDISSSMAEHQALGFQMIRLHNFVVEHDCSCLAFVQLNREGIIKETLDAIGGSDRLAQTATSVSIFKEKSAEEIAQDGAANGNRKLVPVVARHGPGMDGYISMNIEGDVARISEIATIQNSRDFPEQDGDGDNQVETQGEYR